VPSRRERAWLPGQNPGQGACCAPPARGPGAPPWGAARRQDRGHQVAQRAGEVLLSHQDGAVAGVDDIDRAARSRPVRRGEGQDLLDQGFPTPSLGQAAGVRPAAQAPIPPDLGDHDPHPASVPPPPRPPGRPGPRRAATGAPAGSSPPRAPRPGEQDECANYLTGQTASTDAPLVTAGRHRSDQPTRLEALLPSTAGTWSSTVHRSCPRGGGSVAAGWACQLGRFARASRGHYRPLAIGEGRDLPYPADQGEAGAEEV
jgi:hypothetical protein